MNIQPDGVAMPTRRSLIRNAALTAVAASAVGIGAEFGLARPAAAHPTPSFVPVPPSALAAYPQIPPQGYLVEDLGHGLFSASDGPYNFMFAEHRYGVIVVDAPASFGDKLLPAIRSVTRKPITHIIYSHAHVDHTGGAYRYPRKAEIIAHEDTAHLLRRARDPRRPVPTRTFSGNRARHTVHVGGQTLHLDYHGNNHQAGELFIYAPRQRALMHVDLVFPGWAPLKNLAIAQDVPGFVHALDMTLAYRFDTLVAGHFRLGNRDDARLTREYLADLIDAAVEANRTVDPAQAAAGVDPANGWATLGAYFDAVARRCAELMPDKWLTTLGGADVFLLDNAFAVTESQRVDGDPLVGSDRLPDWGIPRR